MNFWKTFLAAALGCLVAMIINLLICLFFFSMLLGLAAGADTTPIVSSNSILKVDLSSSIGERTQEGVDADLGSIPFFELPKSSLGIYDAVRAIDKAAEDKKISMILLTSKDATGISMSCLEELRSALQRFRESGKPIVAYGMNYPLGSYYVASVADKVYMHNDGMVDIKGLGADMMFYKDLLDKLGVNFQLIRHGKFKAAAEQYIKSEISPENRQQNEEMINSIWNSFATDICASRNISIQNLNNAVDSLKIGDAQSAIAYSLIDSAVTTENYIKKICDLVGVSEESDLNVITLDKYAKTVTLPLRGNVKVAVLYAEGEINKDGSGIASGKFVRQIQKVRKDKTIDAVVFRVNSPGGDAQAAEVIREELQLLAKDKPIVCSFGDYAASGGYWISAQSKQIFSDRTTLTGSIGVFSIALNYGKGLKEHLKINTASIGTHKHSTMGGGINPLSEEEIAYRQKFVEHIYTKFMNIVSDGRNMSVADVDSIAQGRVWTGAQGVDVGIVDRIGGIQDAIKYAANLAMGNPEEDYVNLTGDYKVVEFPKTKTDIENIMESFGMSEENAFIRAAKAFFKIDDVTASQLDAVLKDFEESNGIKTYARIPYNYRFAY